MEAPRIDFRERKKKPQIVITFPCGDQVIFTRTGRTTYGKDFRSYVSAKVDGRDTATKLGVLETIRESEMEAELNRMLSQNDSFRAQLYLIGDL